MDHAALVGKAIKLAERGEFEAALRIFKRVHRTNPAHPVTATLIARALASMGCFAEAAPYIDAAMQVGYPRALHPAGIIYNELGRFAEGEQAFLRAIAMSPDDPGLKFDLALLYLSQRDYAKAWKMYAARRDLPPWRANEVAKGVPLWAGQRLEDKRLLVISEQGLGDWLMMARYIPAVRERVPNLVLGCPQSMHRLMRDSFGIPCAPLDDLPPADFRCLIFDLPGIFSPTVASIPPAPYLHVDKSRVALWKWRLGGRSGLKVGLVWQGLSRDMPVLRETNRRRSVDLKYLKPLLGLPDVSFISLQKDCRAPSPIVDWTAELTDFAETAALIMALDIVVSVDTSVANLVGALGKPLWLLNRNDGCWRWRGDPETWYSAVHEFKQPCPGDWATPVRRIVDRLRPLAVAA